MTEQTLLQVGIDWADKKHDYCYVDPSTGQTRQGIFKSDPVSAHDWVTQLRNLHPEGRIEMCLELSRGPLVEILKEYDFIDIYPLNPITANRYRESLYPSLNKDDPMDARLIYDILHYHQDKLHKLEKADEQMELLQGYCEQRRKSVEKRKRLVNEIISTLKHYYPQALMMFGDLPEQMSRSFLKKWPDWQSLSKTRPATLRKFYYAHQCRSDKRIQERIEILQTSRSLTDNQITIELYRTRLLCQVNELDALETTIRTYDKAIHKIYQAMDEKIIFDSIPGAGKVFAPRLCVAMACYASQCNDAKDLAAYSGVAPVRQKSGNLHRIGKRFRIPKFLHQTFVEFAHWSVNHSAWAKAYYNHRKKTLKQGHWHILRNLAFKWIRILFQCWKTKKPYDEDAYIEALKKQNSPLCELM